MELCAVRITAERMPLNTSDKINQRIARDQSATKT